MKKLSKKQIIGIIVAVLVTVAIAATTIVLVNHKKPSTPSNEAETSASDVIENEAITNENGEVIEVPGEQTGEANASEANGAIQEATKEIGKGETTTEPPTHYTTLPPNRVIMTPDLPLDDYALTDTWALSRIEGYYGDDYGVNFDMPNCHDDIYSYAVFKLDDIYTIRYIVTVDIYSGKATEKNMKNNKVKDIQI